MSFMSIRKKCAIRDRKIPLISAINECFSTFIQFSDNKPYFLPMITHNLFRATFETGKSG